MPRHRLGRTHRQFEGLLAENPFDCLRFIGIVVFSRSPVGVDIVNVSGRNSSVLKSQSHAARGALALWSGRSYMIRVSVGPVANNFRINFRPALQRSISFFQDQNTRTFRNDKTVPFFIERATSAFRFVVAG